MQILAFLGIGFFIYQAWQKKTATESLSAMYRGLKGWNLSGTVLSVILRVTVNNPSSQLLTLNSVGGTASFAGWQLGNFQTNSPIKIAPQGGTDIEIPVKLNLLTSGANLLTITTGLLKGQNRKFDFNSVLNVSGVNIPFNFSYELSLKDYLPF
jgi:LEA14-like dessication related protein